MQTSRLAAVATLAFAAGVAACAGGSEGSGWKQYESPVGFTLSYPPAWQVSPEPPGAPGQVKIFNEKAQQETRSEGASSGDAMVEIVPDTFPRFDVQELSDACSHNEPGAPWTTLPAVVTLAGRPAVLCAGRGLDPLSQLPLIEDGYLVEFPPGHVLQITTYAFDTDDATVQTLEQIIATVSFGAAP